MSSYWACLTILAASALLASLPPVVSAKMGKTNRPSFHSPANVSALTPQSGVYGVDMSMQECASMSLSTWRCLRQVGYTFAIIQVFQGGYQMNSRISTCVADAWAAGFQHVDIYVFMCPNCQGNNPPESVPKRIRETVGNGTQNVRYGMLWFDVEQCTNCWNDASSNAAWLASAVKSADALGFHVGVYSSLYEWPRTVGSYSGFSRYPQWYAHYDGVASFSDTGDHDFGGWTTPAIKQFWDHQTLGNSCGVDVDSNWYP